MEIKNGNQALFAFLDFSPKCNEIVWDFIKKNNENDYKLKGKMNDAIINISRCKSEIEKIFYLALQLYIIDVGYARYIIEPQYKISIGFEYYSADFLVFDSCNPSFLLLIECDGHEFHEKTKEQVIYDNEREYKLKSAGYDVLHFSGSEIYNNPYECAEKTLNYISKNNKK